MKADGTVLHHMLAGLGLSGTRLSAHNDRLALLVVLHVAIGRVGNGENVRGLRPN